MTVAEVLPLDLVAGLADEFQSTIIGRPDATHLTLEVGVHQVDGRMATYLLLLSTDGSRITAQEQQPTRLPAFCPERHINYDGSFCLYWSGAGSLEVIDEVSARDWWETLYEYLKTQERVRRLRRWPGVSWAHGAAALHQKRVQDAAKLLGLDFWDDLKSGRLQVVARPDGGNGPYLRLYRHHRHAATYWLKWKRMANLRQLCLCAHQFGRPRKLKKCSDHAWQLSELIVGLHEWTKAENAYWEGLKGQRCCGTMNDCPLLSFE